MSRFLAFANRVGTVAGLSVLVLLAVISAIWTWNALVVFYALGWRRFVRRVNRRVNRS